MTFFSAIRAYGKAADILFSRKFWWFLLFPAMLGYLLFVGGNWLVDTLGDSISHCTDQLIQEWTNDISWLQWLNAAAGFFIRMVLRILYFFFFVSFGGYLLLVIMSPVYSWLSERVEAHITGQEYAFSLGQLLWEIARGAAIAFRNMLLQLVLSVLFFFLSFIPVVGLVTPMLVFLTSAYFYGFSFMDYAIERRHFSVRKSMGYMYRNSGAVTGIGTVFALFLMIPFFSVFVCSFISLLSVIAAALVVEQSEKGPSRCRNLQAGTDGNILV